MSADLIQDLATLSGDPYRFVLYAFPWGEVDTELENHPGPEEWQIGLLCGIRDGLLTPNQAIQQAVASGHGIGKSALVAWIILWAISTFEDTRGVITANTETQLKTKTWVELAKWYRLFIGKSLFQLTATRICSVDPAHSDTWRIDQVPWSERNTEAFAGLHNKGKRIIVIFDEASAIPDVIWETTEGALTDKDTEIIWLVCGNPTRNSGRFRDCFAEKTRWKWRQVDSREVSFTNKSQIDKWIEDYGDDSDFVRIRVRGVFPRVGTVQFISTDLVAEAARREITGLLSDPIILGVDVARFGDNESVLYTRVGRDARSIPPVRLRGLDTMSLATRIVDEYTARKATALFVDEGGVGGGVVDRLRQLRVPVIGVQFGGKADRFGLEGDYSNYANKRAEMWGSMREWLKGGGIPPDKDLMDQLCAPEYGFNNKGEIQLEKKEDMTKRGAASPDIADALALTFAYPVMSQTRSKPGGRQHTFEYDPFADARKVQA